MADIKVLNAGRKQGTPPNGWTPDKRFITIEFQPLKRTEASDVAKQSKQQASLSGTLLQDAVATLNKRK